MKIIFAARARRRRETNPGQAGRAIKRSKLYSQNPDAMKIQRGTILASLPENVLEAFNSRTPFAR
jgi:hypothetical protein